MNPTQLNLTVTIDEANYILAGLQELPGKICNPLTLKLQSQAKVQLAEVNELAKADAATE